jgi:hypothetical protein
MFHSIFTVPTVPTHILSANLVTLPALMVNVSDLILLIAAIISRMVPVWLTVEPTLSPMMLIYVSALTNLLAKIAAYVV